MKKRKKSLVEGWTCDCTLDVILSQVARMLWRKPQEVPCHNLYWNHKENGKPVKVRITIEELS